MPKFDKGDYVRLYNNSELSQDLSWHDARMIINPVGYIDEILDKRTGYYSVSVCYDGLENSLIVSGDGMYLVGSDHISSENNPDSQYNPELTELIHKTATEHYAIFVIDGNIKRVKAGLEPYGESKWHKERGQDPHIYVRQYMKGKK